MAFSESLDFDISAALRSIDQVEDALNRATQQFRQGVASGIDDLRGVSLDLTIDRDSLTRQINAAVDAADDSVLIDPDTSRIRPEIEQAVPPEIDVPIDGDTTAIRQDLARLDDSLDGSRQRTNLLRNALAGIGVAGAIAAIREVVGAFSALEEQVSGAEIVFGDLDQEVVSFATNASGIGLASDEALRAANSFGLFAQNAGLAGQEAADFATTLVTRAADIASLRDLDLNETLDRLRSGLTGETEPLRALGIFLNEANVAARALELGLADASGTIDDAAKIQARYSLILEQSNIAAGNFALTSDGLANTQRRLEAEFRNTLIAVGEGVAPAFQDLLDAASPLLPTLEEFGTRVLPPLVELATSLVPAFGGFLSVLTALSPVLSLLATVASAIPTPLIAMVGIFKLLEGGAGGVARSIFNMTGNLGLAARSFSVLQGAAVVAAIGLAAYANEQQRAAQREADRQAALSALSAALQEGVTAQEALNRVVQAGVSSSESFRGAVDALGLSTGAFAEAALAGGDLGDVLDRLALASGRNVELSQSESQALIEQVDSIRAAASAQLALISAGSDANRVLVENATAANTAADGTVDLGGALADVTEVLAEQERENRRVIAGYESLVQSTQGLVDAQRVLENESPESFLLANAAAAEGTAESYIAFAAAADEAALSEEGMAAAAAILGTDVESLEGFIATATGAIDDFVQSATSGLPTVADVFDDVAEAARDAAGEAAQAVIDAANDRVDDLRAAAAESGTEFSEAQAEAIMDEAEAQADNIRESGRVTAQALLEGLAQGASDLASFRDDLATLTDAGFGDLAALAAEQGGEAGAALADELRTALEAGNLELLNGLRFANDAFETESMQTVDFIRDELAPEMLSATGLLASAVTDSFGENLDFEERVRIAGELAETELDAQGQSIASVAAVEGEEAARAFGAALGLDQEAIDAAVAAGNAIRDNAPVGSARTAGENTGKGFADGLRNARRDVESAAKSLADASEVELKRNLRISSPSQVFMELGRFTAEGFAAGIEGGVGRITTAVGMMSTGAIAATPQIKSPTGDRDDAIIGAVRRLADRVGDNNTINVTGNVRDPYALGTDLLCRQRSLKGRYTRS